MYEIKKNGKHLSYEDVIRYVKLQSNGIYCLCSDDEATGVVVNNDYIFNKLLLFLHFNSKIEMI